MLSDVGLIVGAVVLAAGKSERIGQNKLLLEFNGKTVIAGILDALEAAGINQQIVVLGESPEQVIDSIRPKLGKVKIALNLAPEKDMVSSFQTGLIVISNVDAAFLILGDQPILDPNLLRTMVKEMEENAEAMIVSPIHSSKNGHPLLFRRQLFGEILSIKDQQTTRDIVHSHMDKLVMIESPEWTTWDLDTPQDYERLTKQTGSV
jgi:molybdenum cofactor cytidylyltransferase